MQITLREWEFDVEPAELFEDSEVQIAFENCRYGHLGLGPDAQQKVEAAISEVVKDDVGGRIPQHVGMRSGYLQQHIADLGGIARIGSSDGKAEAHARVVGCPIGDALLDEVGVGDDDDNVVVGADPHAAGFHGDDFAEGAADFNAVANADRLFDEEDEAGEELTDDGLQAQTYAESKRAAENYETAEISPSDSRPMTSPTVKMR